MKTIDLKQGNTINWACTFKVGGVASPLPPGLKAQLRDMNDTLLAELVITRVDENAGLFNITAPTGTEATLPLNTIYCDVMVTDTSDNVVNSETFQLVISRPVTHV